MTNLIDCFQQLPHCITNPRTTWVHLFGFTRNHLHPICIRVSNRELASAVGLFVLHPEIWHWSSKTSETWKPFANAVGIAHFSLCTIAGLHSVWMCDNPTSYSLRWGVPYRRISQPPQKKNPEINPLMVFYILVGLVSTWRGFDIHLSIQPNKAVG